MPTVNSLPANDGHFISLTEAVKMTTDFRNNKDAVLNPDYVNKGILPFSETFNRHLLDVLLLKERCAAIRLYYGMDSDKRIHGILVAVNEVNEDILPPISAVAEPGGYIGELGQRCPDYCPPPSPLNP